MEKNYIYRVIRHFFEKEYSDTTHKKVQQWLVEEIHGEEKTKALYEVWEQTGSKPNAEAKQALNLLKTELGLTTYPKKRHFFYPFTLKAASILLLLILVTGGISYFYLRDDMVKYNTLNGVVKEVDLPDGTKVWLNTGSTISYKKSSNKRIVNLSGEGYFKVETDSIMPFMVETENLLIEVVGTEFNVEAYGNTSGTIVTLESGRVKVCLADRKVNDDFYILEPDQQFIYDPLTGIRIIQVHADEIKSWREGNLIFPHTSFYDIICKLERHFNVKIVINEFENPADYYSVKFVNGESLDQIMNIFKGIAGHFIYEIQD